jgi:hypothetical protein
MLKSALVLAALVQLSPQEGDTMDPLPGAPPSARRVVAAAYDGSARQLEVHAPLAIDPSIEIDGRLDDEAWSQAALLTGFTQYDPVEDVPASQETEVRLLVTDDALYFGIRAWDSSGGVRATLTQRDGYQRSDDFVRVVLDTFNDQRRAYVFMVNPLGVQGDGLWVEGTGRGFGDPIDWNPDFVWQSDGRVDDDGYTAEMRIPIKSLRFPQAELQDWGLQVQRTIRRTGYQESWAPISQDLTNRLEQSGTLRGLRGLDPGLFLEINPTVVGSSQGVAVEGLDGLQRDGAEGELGLNVTYGLTSNLILDGTVNPDFSQVEADAGQIAVNERFALFLPEQRPFFLEGTDVFEMPKRLIYTRSIVNPVGAAKVSGKVGPFTVAYLGAVDELGDPLDEGGVSNPIVNLVRLRSDVGRSSTVGLAYTDRTEPGIFSNRVAAADARLVLGGRYAIELLAAGSHDGESGAAGRYGSLLNVSARRTSRTLGVDAEFEDIDDDFVARSGFIRRTGITRMQGGTNYTFRGDRGALVESWGPSLDAEGIWVRDDFWSAGRPQETELGGGFRAFFRGNIGTFFNYRLRSYDFAPEYYDAFYAGPSEDALRPLPTDQARFGSLHAVSLRTWINSWETVRLSLGGGWDQTPIFSGGAPVDLGDSWSSDVGVTLIPTGQMQFELGARHVSIFRDRDGSRYSSATIPRIQARYQLTRATYVRAIGEYANQERGPLLDPDTGEQVWSCSDGTCYERAGSDQHDFRIETLLGYEPSPGTVVFLGYTRQFRDTSAFSFDQVRPVADGLFLKLSYRFRM